MKPGAPTLTGALACLALVSLGGCASGSEGEPGGEPGGIEVVERDSASLHRYPILR